MTEPYNVGTITVSGGGTVVSGDNTFWAGKVRKNDLFTVPAQGLFARVTADPTENDELNINAWPGAAVTDGAYEIIPAADRVDISARLRELLFGLSLIDPNYDVQVDILADRDEYDDRPGPTATERGFAVLVSDIGDGRAAVYSKLSNAPGDWSGPASFAGDPGNKGWSPILTGVSDGQRRVFKLAGFTGGEGAAPTDNVGEYLKADGTFTATIGDAMDVRGPTGDISGVTPFWQGRITADANAAAARAGLGVERLPIISASGNTTADFNTITGAGWFDRIVRGNSANGWGGATDYGYLHVSTYTPTTGITQSFYPLNSVSGPMRYRTLWGGVWSAWRTVYDSDFPPPPATLADGSVTSSKLANMAQATIKGRPSGVGAGVPSDLTATQLLTIAKLAGAYARDNILGTVSQEAGVPTGEIFERENNVNGKYVRYADGTQICISPEMPDSTASAANGSVYVSPSNLIWTYPASFSEIPTSIGSSVWRAVGNSWLWVHPVNNLSCNYRIVSGIINAVGGARLVAIGRWF